MGVGHGQRNVAGGRSLTYEKYIFQISRSALVVWIAPTGGSGLGRKWASHDQPTGDCTSPRRGAGFRQNSKGGGEQLQRDFAYWRADCGVAVMLFAHSLTGGHAECAAQNLPTDFLRAASDECGVNSAMCPEMARPSPAPPCLRVVKSSASVIARRRCSSLHHAIDGVYYFPDMGTAIVRSKPFIQLPSL